MTLRRDRISLTSHRIAGSETTATTLSCATYYLLRNPEIYDELRKEIRSTFSSYEDIDSASASKLKLVNGICLEAMRMYPPLPFALPRVVPRGGDSVHGHMLPEGVSRASDFDVGALDADDIYTITDHRVYKSIRCFHVLHKLQRPFQIRTRALVRQQ